MSVHRMESNAPSPAPIASMGMKIPHGTPAPRLSTVKISLSTTTMSSVAQIGEENTRSTMESESTASPFSFTLPSEEIKS